MTRQHDAVAPGRLHVLHVSVPTTDGVAAVASTYVRDQVERGWSVTVACPSTGWLGYTARELGAAVAWWPARPAPGRALAGEVLALSRIVARTRPDVVHLHSGEAGLVGRLVLRGRVPTIYQPHGWSFLETEGGRRTAALAWERYAARWTGELLCVSHGEAGVGEAEGIPGPATVAPNGVDLSVLRPVGESGRRTARERLRLPPAPTVVCVGRLAAQKGQRDLVDAWSGVRDRVPEAQLVLVGDGPDRAALERAATPGSGVRLVGARSDVPTWLAAADVVAVPSRWEGMALPPLEAMATARSVVASDVGGLAEAVPDGAGARVPPRDLVGLADELVTRLQDPQLAEDEGWAGRAHVELHHDAGVQARTVAARCLRLARHHTAAGR